MKHGDSKPVIRAALQHAHKEIGRQIRQNLVNDLVDHQIECLKDELREIIKAEVEALSVETVRSYFDIQYMDYMVQVDVRFKEQGETL